MEEKIVPVTEDDFGTKLVNFVDKYWMPIVISIYGLGIWGVVKAYARSSHIKAVSNAEIFDAYTHGYQDGANYIQGILDRLCDIKVSEF